jgi:hypothetical protein
MIKVTAHDLNWAAQKVLSKERDLAVGAVPMNTVKSSSSSSSSFASSSSSNNDSSNGNNSNGNNGSDGSTSSTPAKNKQIDNEEGAATQSPQSPPQSPTSGWGSLFGLETAKQALVESVEWPLKHTELLNHFLGSGGGGGGNGNNGSGGGGGSGGGSGGGGSVLLYGPPGTGKTSLVRACAEATGSSLLELRATDIVHSTGEIDAPPLSPSASFLKPVCSPCTIFPLVFFSFLASVGTSERALEDAFASAHRHIAGNSLRLKKQQQG